MIGLVYHHPSSYQGSKDRLAGLEAQLRAKLPLEQVKAALARGKAAELWATVATVQAVLDPLNIQSAFRPAILSTVGRDAGRDAI